MMNIKVQFCATHTIWIVIILLSLELEDAFINVWNEFLLCVFQDDELVMDIREVGEWKR